MAKSLFASKLSCGNCLYWVPVPDADVPLNALPPGESVGQCYGMPPSVHMVPIPANGGILDPKGQRIQVAPANVRPAVLGSERACSVFIETESDNPLLAS